jgi:hypothetical protein
MITAKVGSEFVLDACEAFDRALSGGDADIEHAREIFFRVANRCAQLEIWLDHKHGDAAPAEHDPIWEDLARRREAQV